MFSGSNLQMQQSHEFKAHQSQQNVCLFEIKSNLKYLQNQDIRRVWDEGCAFLIPTKTLANNFSYPAFSRVGKHPGANRQAEPPDSYILSAQSTVSELPEFLTTVWHLRIQCSLHWVAEIEPWHSTYPLQLLVIHSRQHMSLSPSRQNSFSPQDVLLICMSYMGPLSRWTQS